jgi:hypothetical protein
VKKFVHLINPALQVPVKFIRQYKARKVVYDVELETFASQAIRDAYRLFWRQRSGRRLPEGLKGVSFTNASTFSTRVRVRLLKEISCKHQAVNPTVSCFVTNYLARPELKICKRRGPLNSYTYAQAIQKFPQHLSFEFLRDLYLFAKTNLPEREVVERFLILTPDLFDIPPQQSDQPDQVPMVIDENPIPAPLPVSTPAIPAAAFHSTSSMSHPPPAAQGDLLHSFSSPLTTTTAPPIIPTCKYHPHLSFRHLYSVGNNRFPRFRHSQLTGYYHLNFDPTRNQHLCSATYPF